MNCDICDCAPCETPGFCQACREADRIAARRPKPDHNLPQNWETMPFGALWECLNDPRRHQETAASVLDAAAWLTFQADDVERFCAWLDRRSAMERADILDHLMKIARRRSP